jgi:hypothetical protein
LYDFVPPIGKRLSIVRRGGQRRSVSRGSECPRNRHRDRHPFEGGVDPGPSRPIRIATHPGWASRRQILLRRLLLGRIPLRRAPRLGRMRDRLVEASDGGSLTPRRLGPAPATAHRTSGPGRPRWRDHSCAWSRRLDRGPTGGPVVTHHDQRRGQPPPSCFYWSHSPHCAGTSPPRAPWITLARHGLIAPLRRTARPITVGGREKQRRCRRPDLHTRSAGASPAGTCGVDLPFRPWIRKQPD